MLPNTNKKFRVSSPRKHPMHPCALTSCHHLKAKQYRARKYSHCRDPHRLFTPISFSFPSLRNQGRMSDFFRRSQRTTSPELEVVCRPSLHQAASALFLECHFQGEIQEHCYLVVKELVKPSNDRCVSNLWKKQKQPV